MKIWKKFIVRILWETRFSDFRVIDKNSCYITISNISWLQSIKNWMRKCANIKWSCGYHKGSNNTNKVKPFLVKKKCQKLFQAILNNVFYLFQIIIILEIPFSNQIWAKNFWVQRCKICLVCPFLRFYITRYEAEEGKVIYPLFLMPCEMLIKWKIVL